MAKRKRDYIDALLDAPEDVEFLGRKVRLCQPPLAQLREISKWYAENAKEQGSLMGLYARCGNAVLAKEPAIRERTPEEWELVLHVHHSPETDAFVETALRMCGFGLVADGMKEVGEAMRRKLTDEQATGDVPS